VYWVYAIYNKRYGKIYIGQTEDLGKRLELHNDKVFSKSYTARFEGDWNLIYKEKCDNRESALVREKQLKSYQGRLFVKDFIPR